MAEAALIGALLSVEVLPMAINLMVKINKEDDEKIQSFKHWLTSMKSFLDDNEDHGTKPCTRLKDKVAQIREIAFEIEDTFDDYAFHTIHDIIHTHKITQKAYRIAHNIKHRFPCLGISKNLTSIKRQIEDIGLQSVMFPADGSPSSRAAASSPTGDHQVSTPFLIDDDDDDYDLVGYEKTKKDIVSQLTDGEKRLIKIAVVGPGGSGKTALIKNVFSSRKLEGDFDCYVRVHVSSNFNAEQLLKDMLKQLYNREEEGGDTDRDSRSLLRDYLMEKRYLVFLDDIWRTEHWDSINNAFPANALGSRIIVTTRAVNLASLCASSNRCIHNLNGLEWLDAWTLFCNKAFPDSNGECPADLKDYSTLIVQTCEGLPLAILAVGVALSRQPKHLDVWDRFHNSIGSEITSNSCLSRIGPMLLSGYNDLSSNLKQCFLYFSSFPQDYSVSCGRLMRLWIAEGFAVQTNDKTPEVVAEEYLNKLIQRNLVHVSSWNLDGRRPRNCRVLSIVLKFIVDKCKVENFLSVFSNKNGVPDQKMRRLAVQMGSTEDVEGACTRWMQHRDFKRVRSTFLFGCNGKFLSVIEKSFEDFQLLKVLDMQDSDLTEFPQQILHLVLLRYLSLRNTKIQVIPRSIKKFCFLQTLDLKQTNVMKLPRAIRRLKELRHLFACNKDGMENSVDFDSPEGVEIFEGIKNLTNLQKLSLVKAGKNGSIIRELKFLTQLRKLGLTGLKKEFGSDLCEAIEKMNELRALFLCTINKEEYIELGHLSRPPPFLQRLYLKGCLERLPDWISSLNNLFEIRLMHSKLQHSPLDTLENLPHLVELQLVDCYEGEELVFIASSFKKLKKLVIEELSELHKVVIKEGAMPELEQISFRRCGNLNTVPSGIRYLGKVEELKLYDMNQEFISSLRKGGEYGEMVQHIPMVHSFTRKGESWSFENLSRSSN